MAPQVDEMDEKKFSEELEKFLPSETDEKQKAPLAAPETDNPTTDNPPVTPSTEQPAAPASAPTEDNPKPDNPPDGQQPPTTEQPKPEEKLLAGRFKDTTELAKGLREIGKELGYTDKLLEREITRAEQTGKWDEVENLYKDARSEFSSRPAKESVEIPQKTEDVIPPAELEGRTIQQEINDRAASMALEDMKSTIEGEIIVQNGYEIPKNVAELKTLMKEPGMYEVGRAFLNNLMAAAQDYATQAMTFAKDAQEFPQHNQRIKESSEKQVIDYFKEKHKVDLPPEEAKAMIAEAVKDPANYDFKYNGKIAFLKDNAPLKWVKANRLDDYLEKIHTVIAANARADGAKDILNLQKQVPGTISHSNATPTRVQKREVNLASPKEVELLPDKDVEKSFAEALDKAFG